VRFFGEQALNWSERISLASRPLRLNG